MAGAIERYQKLGLRELLSRVYDYPQACHELSFILRGAYSKVPKNLQAIIFQDTVVAFRFLPQMQTRRGISAANLLLQAAEVALPKQKRVMAVAEFKHAVVAHKRRCKARKVEGGSSMLPQDLVVQIFSFLDMRSLVAAGLVCWSWNLAANDNELWRSQYVLYFGNSENCSELKGQLGEPRLEKVNRVLQQKEKDMVSMSFLDWKEAFKGAYIGNSSRISTSNRGHCWHCKSIVWLSNMRCANVQDGLQPENHKIKPLSLQQVVEYLVEDSSSTLSYLDSDSDSDEESASRLWAVPKHITGNHK
ncbi:F-box protein At5g52880 [Macadamia integrifolia]|uniref:F-box protein At5g52880 n=1 Tax=Macadamia integrifolia TaxID=60698 RepID=UPI001C52C59D|nr:F-box protein At5g52880 [Macadamia integrifolia]